MLSFSWDLTLGQNKLLEQVFTFFFRLQNKIQLKMLCIIITAVEKQQNVFLFKEGDLCCPDDAHSEMLIAFAQYMRLKHEPGSCSGLADVDCYILMSLYCSGRLKNCRELLSQYFLMLVDSDTSKRLICIHGYEF